MIKKYNFKFINKYFRSSTILYFTLSLVLTFIWFKDGNIMGAGEFGISFYNLNQLADISIKAWGTQVLGGSTGYTSASGPTFALLGFIQKLGVSGFLIQAALMFFMLFSSLYSFNKLMSLFFPNIHSLGRISGAFFYVFNFYGMMNIWNRFLPNLMLFYSILPALIYIYLIGINQRRYSTAILLSVICAIFSYAFNGPSQALLFWSLIFFLSIYMFILKPDFYIFKYFFLSSISWLLFNFWWISQSLYYRSSANYQDIVDSFFTILGNQFTLDSLSNSLGQLNNLFLLKHGTFFYDATDLPFTWSMYYSTWLTLAIEWVVVVAVLFVAIKNIKHIWIRFSLLLFVVGLLISKGNSEPFGEVFNFFFQKISFIQFFRNPFEKLGLIIALSYSLLFGYTIADIYNRLKIKSYFLSRVHLYLSLIYVFIFLGLPFFTVLVFSSGNPPANNPKINYQVRVPEYYQQLSSWLEEHSGPNRFISFPLGGEGIFYNWEKGYAGIEPSGIIFKTSNISYNTTIPYFTKIADTLEKLFLNYNDFNKVAAKLGVKYILFRPDINFKVAGIREPNIIKERFDFLTSSISGELNLVKEFGPLKVYEINKNSFLPKIYPSTRIVNSNQVGQLEPLLLYDSNINDSIVKNVQKLSYFNKDMVYQDVIYKKTYFNLPGPDNYSFSDDPSILPYSGRLSTDPLYNLVLLRDLITIESTKDITSKSLQQIMFLGKRLTESRVAIEKSDEIALKKSLDRYKDFTTSIMPLVKSLIQDPGLGEIWQSNYLVAFGSHKIYLNTLQKLSENNKFMVNELTDTSEYILKKMGDLNIIPYHEPRKNDQFPIRERQIYQFEVDTDGEYELIFPEKNIRKYFVITNNINIQLDNELIMKDVHINNDQLSFGSFKLNKGIHEISFNIFEPLDLFHVDDSLTLTADKSIKEYKYKINDLDPFSIYSLSFDYIIRSGSAPKVILVQNIDKAVDLNFRPLYEKILPVDDYWFGLRNYKTRLKTSHSADSADVVFVVKPWNDCVRIFVASKSKCLDEIFFSRFNRVTDVEIKNLKIYRSRLSDPILRKININFVNSNFPKIDYQRVDQTKYLVSIKGATNPYVLNFSELFNSDWVAYYDQDVNYLTDTVQFLSGEKKILSHFLTNGYANGWWVERTGDYSMIIEFIPQRFLEFGYLFTLLMIICGGLFSYYLRKKNK